MPDNRKLINSLARGLDLINSMSEEAQGLTFSEIMKANNMTVATANRYLYTLKELGYVIQDPTTKKYQLTPKIMKLGIALLRNMDLRSILLPHMINLNKEFDINVTCGIISIDEVLVIERINASDLKALNLTIGTRLPLNCCALGKAILAFEDADKVRSLIDKMKYIKRTPFSITDPDQFLTDLKETKQRGYACSDRELVQELKTYAVPVFKDGKVEGALAASFNLAKDHESGFYDLILAKIKDISEKVSV